MAFGERLQEVRRRNGLTQEEFAEQLQVSRQSVSKWESGRGYPELEKVLYICACYDTTMDELFADELPESARGEPPDEPQALPSHTLGKALEDFYANLSPYNKAVGVVLLFAVLMLGPAYVYISRVLEGGADDMMTVVWISAIIVFGIAEAATANLVSIWFVAGAAAGLVTAELGGSEWLQVLLFLVVSVAALVVTRPLARRMLGNTITPTNADRVLRHTARVTEEIDNGRSSGAVYIDGKTWTARSEDGSVIAKDKMAEVVRMEGVKLFVTEKKEV